jgi:hypothetical protein
LRGCRLRGCRLRGCQLRGCRLRGCWLRGCGGRRGRWRRGWLWRRLRRGELGLLGLPKRGVLRGTAAHGSGYWGRWRGRGGVGLHRKIVGYEERSEVRRTTHAATGWQRAGRAGDCVRAYQAAEGNAGVPAALRAARPRAGVGSDQAAWPVAAGRRRWVLVVEGERGAINTFVH